MCSTCACSACSCSTVPGLTLLLDWRRCQGLAYCSSTCREADTQLHQSCGECWLLQQPAAAIQLGECLRDACLALRLLQHPHLLQHLCQHPITSFSDSIQQLARHLVLWVTAAQEDRLPSGYTQPHPAPPLAQCAAATAAAGCQDSPAPAAARKAAEAAVAAVLCNALEVGVHAQRLRAACLWMGSLLQPQHHMLRVQLSCR